MASRNFKQSWAPTPLHLADPARSEGPALGLAPLRPEAGQPVDIEDAVIDTMTNATERASAAGTALAAKAGTALASAATSALVTARSTAAGSVLANAAGVAFQSAKALADSTAGTAVASAAATALAKARSSAAATVQAASLGPLPSPVALINRASFIFRHLLRATLREVIRGVLSLIRGKRERTVAQAREMREFAERLGGMWVTLMRLASVRTDLLGAAYCRELALTRDLAAPSPFAEIRKVVEADMLKVGTTFEETFVEFDETPLNVRSFTQVHRARLAKNNREVLVRVRSPDAPQRAQTDWRYLRVLLFFLRQLDLEPHLRWDDLGFEVKKATDDCLDLRTEVEELRRIRKVLRKRRIYVPMIYRRYCTERVLVQEYIQGVSVSDLVLLTHKDANAGDDWMKENQVDPRRLWRRLFSVHHELLFEHNLFYTELSPSSIILLRGNRLAFVSLGTVGSLDADLQRRYRNLYRALLASDYSKAADYYLTIGPALPYKDITDMKQQSLRFLRKWESRTHIKNCPYREKSLGSAVGQLARCATEQELPTFWNLARLQLSEQILNTSLEFFDPTKSSLKALRRYEISAQIRSIKNAVTKNVRKRVDSALDTAQLNMQLLENFENDGEYLRNRLAAVQSKLTKASAIGGRMVVLISKLAVVVLLLQGFLYFKQNYHVSVPLAERGTLGRVLSLLRPQTTASWVLLFVVLFYFRRFLSRLAQQLFTKSVSPNDVA